MDPELVERLRARLERERDSLRSELIDYGANPDDGRGVALRIEGGFADSAQTTAERARVLSLVEGLRSTLAEVEHALAKIAQGSRFGICERCGREIDPERLEALAWARLCIECKQRAR